jgi:hypothetical protein
VGRGWHAGRAAPDPRASAAIALTTWLDAVVSTSAATEVTRAWLPGIARTPAAIYVMRLQPSRVSRLPARSEF